MNSGNGRGV